MEETEENQRETVEEVKEKAAAEVKPVDDL